MRSTAPPPLIPRPGLRKIVVVSLKFPLVIKLVFIPLYCRVWNNPNGVEAFSPGLAASAAYPGYDIHDLVFNPNGVASLRATCRLQPRWG